MTDQLRAAALRAAVWQTVEARAKQLKDEARAELTAIPVGETVAAKWGDRLLAKASMGNGAAKLVVTQPQAFLAWVEAKHPDEIVRAVNPAYVAALAAKAKELGLGAVLDSQGEVVPGVEIVTGDPVVSVRKEKNAAGLVADMLATGQLQFDGLKAIETADMGAGASG